jgi:RHS repeat-associated protein
VQYDYAGRTTSLQYLKSFTETGTWLYGGPPPTVTTTLTTETMSYNVNGQMASLNFSGGVTGGIQYTYSATRNNGQITQAVDTISGEVIAYQYDSLKRLTSASSTGGWAQSYQYDGFGNLTGKTLNGTLSSIPVTAATNRLTNAVYDANGNMTSGAGATIAYDEANRMKTAQEVSGGIEYYVYAADNKQVYRMLPNGNEEFTLYGGFGEKLGVFSIGLPTSINYPSPAVTALRSNVYFAGKMIWSDDAPVYQDRLGTNRAGGARFYPFGDEITSTSNDREKFGTYTRDSYTGLDYADQRYFASTYGRFNTADRFGGSALLAIPTTWNRYSYAHGDPVNRNDRTGQMDDECADDCSDGDGGFSGGGDIVFTATGIGVADPDPDPCMDAEGCGPSNQQASPIRLNGGSRGNPKVSYKGGAAAALNYQLAHMSTNCQKVLPTNATLVSDAKDLTFWDGRADGAMPLSSIPGVVQSGSNRTTVGQELGGSVAVTLSGAGGTVAPQVVLGGPFFNELPSSQGLTLLHELLHYALQEGDVAFDRNYGITGKPGDSASSAMSKWLANDCKN